MPAMLDCHASLQIVLLHVMVCTLVLRTEQGADDYGANNDANNDACNRP